MLYKLALIPILIAIACLLSGVFGAVHDQISFTVSPEYFFELKFDQFSIAPSLRNRIGASLVGWYASWWMGLFIGPPIAFGGLTIAGYRAYFKNVIRALLAVMVTASIFGGVGLAISFFAISPENLPDIQFPESVENKTAFARAGMMHSFSYLGGIVGIFAGAIFLVIVASKQKMAMASAANGQGDRETTLEDQLEN